MLRPCFFPKISFFLFLLSTILQMGNFSAFQENTFFCPSCVAAEERVTITVFPGLGEVAEAVLRGKGQPMGREGKVLVLDVSDRKKTLSNLMHAHSGLIYSMHLNEENSANKSTTKTKNGYPYLRKWVKVDENGSVGYVEDSSDNAYRYVHDPSHPDAIKEGKYKDYVAMPNISIGKERADYRKAFMYLRAVIEIIRHLDPSMVIIEIEPTMPESCEFE